MKHKQHLSTDLRHVWHPCSQMKDFEDFPPLRITRGRGVHLYDSRGRKYIDGISSWWVNLLGHNNPRLTRALCAQAKKLEHVIFAGCTHEPAVRLARELARVAPAGLTRVFFADNGSSAVEAALKMSFQYAVQTGKKRPGFVALGGAYHGETVGALSVGGIPLYRKVFSPLLFKTTVARAPSCPRCPFGLEPGSCAAECFRYLERAVEKAGPGRLAGVIVEPLVQCANIMNMYPPAYLKRLRALCTRERIHFIADEIAVGFGRTGKMFACNHAAVSPDIMVLSKGITGGYMPFSAVLATQKIYNCFYGDYADMKAFLHSHSYSGNPLGASLALEVLRIFREERVLSALKPKIRLMRGLLAGLRENPWAANVRQTGFIGAFDIVDRRRRGRPFDPKRRTGLRVARQAIRLGAFLRPLGDTIYFMPPLTITAGELKVGEVVG
jgi:adenosylmethionine-8-amino-7-oxononanoate aminotransferase